MKKVFSILLVAVCCLALATPAQAQLKWGVKGGVNMSKIDWNGGYEGNKDNSAGFFIGPMAEFTIPVIGLGIDGAVMYSQRGNEVNLIQDSEVITKQSIYYDTPFILSYRQFVKKPSIFLVVMQK